MLLTLLGWEQPLCAILQLLVAAGGLGPKPALPCSVISCHAGRAEAGFVSWGAEGPRGAELACQCLWLALTGQGR